MIGLAFVSVFAVAGGILAAVYLALLWHSASAAVQRGSIRPLAFGLAMRGALFILAGLSIEAIDLDSHARAAAVLSALAGFMTVRLLATTMMRARGVTATVNSK